MIATCLNIIFSPYVTSNQMPNAISRKQLKNSVHSLADFNRTRNVRPSVSPIKVIKKPCRPIKIQSVIVLTVLLPGITCPPDRVPEVIAPNEKPIARPTTGITVSAIEKSRAETNHGGKAFPQLPGGQLVETCWINPHPNCLGGSWSKDR